MALWFVLLPLSSNQQQALRLRGTFLPSFFPSLLNESRKDTVPQRCVFLCVSAHLQDSYRIKLLCTNGYLKTCGQASLYFCITTQYSSYTISFFVTNFLLHSWIKIKIFLRQSGKGAISIPKKSRPILQGSLSAVLLLFCCGYFSVLMSVRLFTRLSLPLPALSFSSNVFLSRFYADLFRPPGAVIWKNVEV